MPTGATASISPLTLWLVVSSNVLIISCPYFYGPLHELIYENYIIHADETLVNVMRIDNAKIKNGKKTYIWVYRNYPTHSEKPIVVYESQPFHRADRPRKFLESFSGTVVTDSYQVYHKLGKGREYLNVGSC